MDSIINKSLSSLSENSADFIMILAVVGILTAMILPVHPVLLDLLLAFNITTAFIVLITSMYAKSPLEFSIFPSMLLILTLLRLSLNVASTRLILLRGNEGIGSAGAIIKSFGSFVVGGNYIIGLIIFIILVLINFIVITKGSGRIAEVAARFTLDAMPGKQMAIDADLNSGIIDENEARQRRKEIANESRFHGSMDGASKFVRVDAIAGIVITLINIIGGLIIGIFQKKMSFAAAARSYTLLTIGDGLVTQIPSLIISTASGILVSRSASENRMGQEYAQHFLANNNPILLGSLVIILLGLSPGMPALPFVSLGVLIGGGVLLYNKYADRQKASQQGEEEKSPDEAGPENVDHLLTLDIIELEMGYGLVYLVDNKDQGSDLLSRIRAIRRQFASEMGIVVSPIHIRDNLKLKPSDYRVLIKGVEIDKAELMVDHLLAMDPGDASKNIEGVPTMEPAFKLPALWIHKSKEEEAKYAGFTVVDIPTVIATHLSEIIRNNTAELLGRQEVQHLLDNLAKTYPKAVEELVPNLLSIGNVQKVLQNLLHERVSIKNLLTIVETLADYAPVSKDTDLLSEYVRQKFARNILEELVTPDKILSVITLENKVEDLLTKGIQHTEQGSYLSVDPQILELINMSIKKVTEKVIEQTIVPVILCSPVLRRHLKRAVENFAPTLTVISHAEVIPNIQIKSVGKVTI